MWRAAVSQLRCGSARAAWCSSATAGDLDPSRTASSLPWWRPQPSCLSPHLHPHLHLRHRISYPHLLPPLAGIPVSWIEIISVSTQFIHFKSNLIIFLINSYKFKIFICFQGTTVNFTVGIKHWDKTEILFKKANLYFGKFIFTWR